MLQRVRVLTTFASSTVMAGLLLAGCGGSTTATSEVPGSTIRATSTSVAGTVSTTSTTPATTASRSSAASGRIPAGGTGTGSSTTTPTKSNVAYASSSPSQVLDLWLPPNPSGPTPLVINIHGGAFKSGDKSMETGNVAALLAKGYAVASVNYRLSGEALFPAAVQDVKAAVRYLRANAATYNLNPDQFATWGASAGGNLAAMVGVTGDQRTVLDDPALGNGEVSSAVQVVVDWFGPADFLAMDGQRSTTKCASPDSHDPASSPESMYVGGAIQSVPDKANAASPVTYIATATKLPRFVIAHGDSDCQIPTGQSVELDEKLRAAGATSDLTILPGATHGDPQFNSTQVAPAIAVLDKTFGR